MTILLPIRKECLPSNLGVDGCKWSQMTFKMFVNMGGDGGLHKWWSMTVNNPEKLFLTPICKGESVVTSG